MIGHARIAQHTGSLPVPDPRMMRYGHAFGGPQGMPKVDRNHPLGRNLLMWWPFDPVNAHGHHVTSIANPSRAYITKHASLPINYSGTMSTLDKMEWRGEWNRSVYAGYSGGNLMYGYAPVDFEFGETAFTFGGWMYVAGTYNLQMNMVLGDSITDSQPRFGHRLRSTDLGDGTKRTNIIIHDNFNLDSRYYPNAWCFIAVTREGTTARAFFACPRHGFDLSQEDSHTSGTWARDGNTMFWGGGYNNAKIPTYFYDWRYYTRALRIDELQEIIWGVYPIERAEPVPMAFSAVSPALPMFVGSSPVTGVFVGSTPITALAAGSTQLWP